MAAGCVQLRGERESYLEARDRVVSMDAAPEAPVTRVATWPGPTHHLALVRAWTPDEGLADSSRLASATPPPCRSADRAPASLSTRETR
jgi:hypothetical protein